MRRFSEIKVCCPFAYINVPINVFQGLCSKGKGLSHMMSQI